MSRRLYLFEAIPSWLAISKNITWNYSTEYWFNDRFDRCPDWPIMISSRTFLETLYRLENCLERLRRCYSVAKLPFQETEWLRNGRNKCHFDFSWRSLILIPSCVLLLGIGFKWSKRSDHLLEFLHFLPSIARESFRCGNGWRTDSLHPSGEPIPFCPTSPTHHIYMLSNTRTKKGT